jgi:hypothetical protein
MSLAELLPEVRQLPADDKIKLIRILAEDLDRQDDVSPFEPNKIHYLPTPYNSFGAAEILLKELSKAGSEPN